MTNNEEVEKIANKIAEISDKSAYWSQSFKDLAEWHIREKQIAVLEARIHELQRNCFGETPSERLNYLVSQLSAIKKDSDK